MLLSELIEQVSTLRAEILQAEDQSADLLARVHHENHESARNLIHYVALRQHDLRQLQDQLAKVGLSSLGRMEAGVLGHLDLVLRALNALAGHTPAAHQDQGLSPVEGRTILDKHTERVLGPTTTDRQTRIMVTMPSEAATDKHLVQGMVEAGMDIARINCAHDSAHAWTNMARYLAESRSAQGRSPLIAFDLAGPKLRTGPLQPGPQVHKVRPERDQSGNITAPSYLWLNTDSDSPPWAISDDEHTEQLPVQLLSAERFSALAVGDVLRVRDARGSRRKLKVEARTPTAVLVSARKTIYWATNSVVHTDKGEPLLQLGQLEPQELALRLQIDDTLVLTPDMSPQVVPDSSPFTMGCSLPEIFEQVREDEHVWFDDGKIGAEISHQTGEQIQLKITQAKPGGTNLRAEKGINFPDTELRIPALTDEDKQNLAVVAKHADIINMSFVSSPTDVAELLDNLVALEATSVDVVLKIETVAAFRSLPELLLEAMRWPGVGVMIARGDLAVEAGFERMAELQEEILWLCEAAHVPVIWATQVLESMAKSGLPSRSEITDAAMAQRAEAVMLNKGPYIRETIAALHDILSRMDGHSSKKRDMLRALKSWRLPTPDRTES